MARFLEIKDYSSSAMNDVYSAVDINLWNINNLRSRKNLQILLNRTKNQRNGIQIGIQNGAHRKVI